MFESLRKKFGKNIRAKRLRLSMTQERLAELAGIHPTYLGSVERGERNVGINNIEKIAKALDCRVAQLFEDLEK